MKQVNVFLMAIFLDSVEKNTFIWNIITSQKKFCKNFF